MFSVSQNTYLRILGCSVTNNFGKKCRRKRSWLKMRHYLDTCLYELIQITNYLSQETGVWAEVFIQDPPKEEVVPVIAVHRKYEVLFRKWLQCKLISKGQEGQNFVKIIVGWKKDLI